MKASSSWSREQGKSAADFYTQTKTVYVEGLPCPGPVRPMMRTTGSGTMTTLERAPTTLPGPWQAVCFDLDGLLVDTEPIWMDAKEVLFERYGVAYDVADHVAVFGTSEDESARLLHAPHRPARIGDGPDPARVPGPGDGDAGRRDLRSRPGALELVAHLRGRVPIAVATNTRRSIAQTWSWSTAGLGGLVRRHRHQRRDDGPSRSPTCTCWPASAWVSRPAVAVGLEDSPTGVRAVKAAGLHCIAVPSDPGSDVSHRRRDRQTSLLELIDTGGGQMTAEAARARAGPDAASRPPTGSPSRVATVRTGNLLYTSGTARRHGPTARRCRARWAGTSPSRRATRRAG